MTKDELTDNARTLAQKLTLWFKAFTGFYVALMPWSLVFTLILIGGIFIAWLTHQGTSENEQKAEDARTETIKTDAESNVAEGQVERSKESVAEAEKASQKAQKRTQEARQKPKANVNIQEAMDNCEKVYPGECK